MKKHGVTTKCAAILSAAMTLAVLPSVSAVSTAFAANDNAFPYAMFASSDAEGAITVNSKHFCLNGDIASNGTIVTGKQANINGKKKENAEIDMLYIGDKLSRAYFGNAQTVDSLDISQPNINMNTPVDVSGDASLKGNVNISSSVKADSDIVISGNVNNVNNSVLYSEFGDIIIDSNNVNLTGIVYAPLGNVEITANNINLNNVVIIADTITLNSNNVNANYGRNFAQAAGNVSEETRADYIHKLNSWSMNKEIDATVDLISQYYTLTPIDAGEYSQLNILGMMLFDIEQYEVEGYGNLSIMKTDGANQMSTIVLTPYDKELPLISTDYMYNGEARISYIEFYGLCSDPDSADYQKVISNLSGLTDKYSGLMSVAPTPAWYDDIRTMGLFKMTNYSADAVTGEMLSDSFRITLESSLTLPQLNDEQKAAKLDATQQYCNNLVDMGGVSTDMFKMGLGVEKTKDFFNKVFFGTALQ